MEAYNKIVKIEFLAVEDISSRDAYNKIVKIEFLAVEDISSRDDGKVRYDMFVKAYNETREHDAVCVASRRL